MPRFPEESVACLKRTMLARAAQEFTFSPADVEAVVKETGLNQAQVQVWAENFRFRYTTSKERMDFLASDGFDKVT